MNIILRDYQYDVVKSVIAESLVGINRQLIILPTGSGKTIVMAAIAKHFNKKTLLLAHREELINQAVEKFKLFWPDVDIGVCMANQNEIDCQVVIGSIQSCSRQRRIERLKERGFELLMIDEAHHSASDSYQSVIKALEFGKMNPKKLLLGVTATPQRSDKLGLGETFTHVTFSRSISTMIKGGYLSPIIGRKILTNFIFDKISNNNGDFAINELSEAVNTPERNAFIAAKFKEYASERKGIAFCCDVQHCKDLSDSFKAARIESAAVWGDMEPIERKTILKAFRQGQIQVVTSCGILTEGYDEPSVNIVIMARPTKSSGLFTQCIGRGLRLWPGKENCLVLDFTDTYHTLDGVMSLNDAIPEVTVIEDRSKTEREEIDRLQKVEILTECDHVYDILGSTRFVWVQIDDEWSLQDDDMNEIVMRPTSGGYIAELYSPDGSSTPIVNSPLPLEYCSGICEDYARRHLKISFADVGAGWMHSGPATSGQYEYLKKNKAWQDGITKIEASIEIRKIIAFKNKQKRQLLREPMTDRQRYLLTNHGIDSSNFNKFTAMKAIAKLKQKEQVMHGQ